MHIDLLIIVGKKYQTENILLQLTRFYRSIHKDILFWYMF